MRRAGTRTRQIHHRTWLAGSLLTVLAGIGIGGLYRLAAAGPEQTYLSSSPLQQEQSPDNSQNSFSQQLTVNGVDIPVPQNGAAHHDLSNDAQDVTVDINASHSTSASHTSSSSSSTTIHINATSEQETSAEP